MLVILVVILGFVVKDIYSTTGISWLLGLNVVAFIVDVILVDYHAI